MTNPRENEDRKARKGAAGDELRNAVLTLLRLAQTNRADPARPDEQRLAAALTSVMRVVETLTDGERLGLIRASSRVALAYALTGDVRHLTEHAKNLLGTLDMYRYPAIVEAVRRPPEPRDEARATDDVLATVTDKRPR